MARLLNYPLDSVFVITLDGVTQGGTIAEKRDAANLKYRRVLLQSPHLFKASSHAGRAKITPDDEVCPCPPSRSLMSSNVIHLSFVSKFLFPPIPHTLGPKAGRPRANTIIRGRDRCRPSPFGAVAMTAGRSYVLGRLVSILTTGNDVIQIIRGVLAAVSTGRRILSFWEVFSLNEGAIPFPAPTPPVDPRGILGTPPEAPGPPPLAPVGGPNLGVPNLPIGKNIPIEGCSKRSLSLRWRSMHFVNSGSKRKGELLNGRAPRPFPTPAGRRFGARPAGEAVAPLPEPSELPHLLDKPAGVRAPFRSPDEPPNCFTCRTSRQGSDQASALSHL